MALNPSRLPSSSCSRWDWVLRLNLAVSWEMLLLMLIVYLPFPHEPFSTFALSLTDWLIIGRLVVTVVPVLEFAKWMVRKGWFGNVE